MSTPVLGVYTGDGCTGRVLGRVVLGGVLLGFYTGGGFTEEALLRRHVQGKHYWGELTGDSFTGEG